MSVRAGVCESLVVLKKITTGGYYYMYLLPMRENSRENERENSRENERGDRCRQHAGMRASRCRWDVRQQVM